MQSKWLWILWLMLLIMFVGEIIYILFVASQEIGKNNRNVSSDKIPPKSLLKSFREEINGCKVYLYDYDITTLKTYNKSQINDIKINRSNFNISESERDYIERVVMAECGNQEYRGMLGVVQTIADRAEILGISPYEVVTMPKQYARAWSYASEEIKQAVRDVLDNGVRVWNEKVTSFHSGNYPTSWGKLLFIETIQDHHFYTWYKESEK